LSCSQIQIFSRRSRCNDQFLSRKNQLLPKLFGIILPEHACAKRVDLGKEEMDALDIGWARHSFLQSLVLRTDFDIRKMCLFELHSTRRQLLSNAGRAAVRPYTEAGIGNRE
jgi:hypothetical protein